MSSNHSDEAVALAGDICASIVYPLLADFAQTTQRYCTWHGMELHDEQIEEMTRAMASAVDGTLSKIAGCVDTRRAFGLLEQLGADDA